VKGFGDCVLSKSFIRNINACIIHMPVKLISKYLTHQSFCHHYFIVSRIGD